MQLIHIKTKSYEKEGVLYWKSNDRPVPLHVFKEAGIFAPVAQAEAIDKSNNQFLEEYRKQMENHEYSEEELFEMRAAFGPGETVVNVITGKTVVM